MRIVNPTFEIITPDNFEATLRLIEAAGRTCYKSEDKMTAETNVKLIDKLKSLKHESVFEHSSMTVKFINDRGVSHEEVRHRLAAYSQECVTGDTVIKGRSLTKKNLTIRELYDRAKTAHGKTHNKTLNVLSMDESSGEIVPNIITHIFHKGPNHVYEVRTRLGYSIKCTLNHKFFTDSGEYVKLKNIKVGDLIGVNGRPSLITVSDGEITRLYLKLKMTPTEIAEYLGVKVRIIYNKLHALGIFEKHLNDNDLSKYNHNHTDASYRKMSHTIQQQYDDGRVVWNKGIREYEHPSVRRQGDSLRTNHHDNGFEHENSNWREGRSQSYYSRIKSGVVHCEFCGAEHEPLEVHHLDRNRKNNKRKNLMKLCRTCHKLLHAGWHVGTFMRFDEIVSIDYAGVEDTYDLEMADPFHNYVANGFITHNSTRYCNYTKEKFDSEITLIDPFFFDPDEAKQEVFVPHVVDNVNGLSLLGIKNDPFMMNSFDVWFITCLWSEWGYNTLSNQFKRTPQEARSVLPNSLKTEIVVTCNIREWWHILDLRTSDAAHPQIRQVMVPLGWELAKRCPMLFGQYADRKHAHPAEQSHEMRDLLDAADDGKDN